MLQFLQNTPQIPFLIFTLLLFYLLVIRPNQQTEKKKKEALEKIKPGMEVVTQCGWYAKVAEVKGEKVILTTDKQGSTITIHYSMVEPVKKEETPKEKKQKKTEPAKQKK